MSLDDALKAEHNMTLADLAPLEAEDGGLRFPFEVGQRQQDGTVKRQIKMTFRPLFSHHLRNARMRTVHAFDQLEYDGRKLDREKDLDLFEAMEKAYVLMFAVCDAEKPYAQMFDTLEELERAFLPSQLEQMYDYHTKLIDVTDPRFDRYKSEDVFRMILKVAEAGSLAPLAAMPGVDQYTCMLSMAKLFAGSVSVPSSIAQRMTFEAGSYQPSSSPKSSE